MQMTAPNLPLNYAHHVPYEDLVTALRLIQHATAATPDDGGHHEAAHDLSSGALAKIDARAEYEREQKL